MTIGKASAFTLSLIAAVGFGVWVSPYVMTPDEERDTTIVEFETSAAPAAPTAAVPEAVGVTSGAVRVSRARKALATPPVHSPALHEQLEPLFNKGADMTVAAEGFRDAEQFASVARAARNTGVPFMVLKHRVVDEGKSLAEAIRESKPEANGVIEAERAVAEAWSDIASVAG
jgi:hypothetical protein